MADVIIQDTTLRDIAEAVRVRNGTAEKIPVSDIARQIREGTEIEDCENHIVSSTITDWSYYCNNGARLHTLPFIDTSNGTNFNSMCYNASGGWGNNLFDIELNCTKAETMTYAFYGSKARKITLHFNEWSMTSTKLASAFRNASEVTEITITGKIFVNSNDLNLAYCSRGCTRCTRCRCLGFLSLAATAGQHAQYHNKGQNHCECSFHFAFSFQFCCQLKYT